MFQEDLFFLNVCLSFMKAHFKVLKFVREIIWGRGTRRIRIQIQAREILVLDKDPNYFISDPGFSEIL